MAFFNQAEEAIQNSAGNASVEVRMAFLRKVYSLLALSLLSATIGAYLGRSIDPGLMLPLIIGQIGVLIFAMAVQRKPVWNLVALFGFTTLSGLTLGPVMNVYNADVIQDALVLTTLVFGGLTGYVLTSKKDFSFLSGFLFTGLLIIIGGSLLNMFFFKNSAMEFIISGGGVILFSGFILYDTSNILHRYDPRDYTSATLSLYLDVINLFLFILRLLGGRN